MPASHPQYLGAYTLPPLLGYLILWFGSVLEKSRYPEQGAGYEPTGTAMMPMLKLRFMALGSEV